MKNKKKILYGLLLLLVVGGLSAAYYENRGGSGTQTQSSTLETTATTTESSEPLAEREEITEKLVQVYVDPALYTPNEESESDYVWLRKEANADSDGVKKYHRGTWLTFVEEKDGWVKTEDSEGNSGWLPKDNTQMKEVTRLAATKHLEQVKIVLDAGHGGIDTGAESADQQFNEKTLTLKTVKAVGAALEKAGAQVSYTRTTDKQLELSEIVEKSQAAQGDLFISFHFDDYDYPNGMNGSTTYYYYSRDEAFAEVINQALKEELPLNNNGIREGNYYVIRESYIPSILLELGYMNSDEDLEAITKADFPDKVAEAVVKAVETYVAKGADF